jgi:orotidine-5'-phosphate decarboxylase
MASFGDRAIERTRRLGHPLCVGLDPYLERIPAPFRRGTMAPADPATADAVAEFCRSTIDLIADDAAIVKPQAALFERLGWHGCRALDQVVRHARAAGLPVLLDAKRGDIADTSAGYAQAYLASDAPCAVDALTVNPYLGPASLAPFVLEAERAERGVVVLVRSSSPDSSLIQSAATTAGPVFAVVAKALGEYQDRLTRGTSGWSSLGVSVAATHAGDTEHVRGVLPRALFLVLGYGAQGASAADAVRGFRRGPAALEGGVVSSSRPILFPSRSGDAHAWESGVRAALGKARTELGEAVA